MHDKMQCPLVIAARERNQSNFPMLGIQITDVRSVTNIAENTRMRGVVRHTDNINIEIHNVIGTGYPPHRPTLSNRHPLQQCTQ